MKSKILEKNENYESMLDFFMGKIRRTNSRGYEAIKQQVLPCRVFIDHICTEEEHEDMAYTLLMHYSPYKMADDGQDIPDYFEGLKTDKCWSDAVKSRYDI